MHVRAVAETAFLLVQQSSRGTKALPMKMAMQGCKLFDNWADARLLLISCSGPYSLWQLSMKQEQFQGNDQLVDPVGQSARREKYVRDNAKVKKKTPQQHVL